MNNKGANSTTADPMNLGYWLGQPPACPSSLKHRYQAEKQRSREATVMNPTPSRAGVVD